MKKIYTVAVCALLTMVAGQASASFVNGGFESGDFTGWNQDGGYYNWGGTYTYTGDPGKSAVVSAGLDPYTGNNLNMVYSGNYSARVNNYDWGYHFSTITQRVNGWADDSIYFAYAAVLEDPGHSYAGHMRVSLYDETASTYLYDVYFDYYTAGTVLGGNWNTYGYWGYTDWEVVQLDTSLVKGHDLTLTLLASDCGAGGHGGYAYLDGFGAAPPPPGDVPEPATMLLFGSGLAGLVAARRKKQIK